MEQESAKELLTNYMNILWARTPKIAAVEHEHVRQRSEDVLGFLVCMILMTLL